MGVSSEGEGDAISREGDACGRCDLMGAGDAITWKSTLMKMREDDVVSSSVITRYSITPHGSASECSRCAKNLAMLRSLLVSRRWIIAYCLAKASSKSAWYVAPMQQKRSPREP